MAMYGNFVVTSMGKGQLVKENHVFFQGNMATVGNTWDTSRDSWDQTKHGRLSPLSPKIDQPGYENQWEGLSGCPIYYGK